MLYYNLAEKRLELAVGEFKKPFFVEFKKYACLSRKDLKNLAILRAAGFHKYKHPADINIIDLSAGFGQDAYVFYLAGFKVKLIERSETVAQLLQDGLRRAGCALQIYKEDARDYLSRIKQQNLSCDYPDILYFDPMFPEKNKTALAQKSARLLKNIVGHDEDAESVFNQALTVAKRRVIIKRPVRSDFIAHQAPDIIFRGKIVRFDVYLTARE